MYIPLKSLHNSLVVQLFSSRCSCCLGTILLLLLASRWRIVSSDHWPYLQIYPPVNETDDRTSLHFALVLSSGGQLASFGVIPGVQIALDYINSQPSILPEYTLHYTLTDSQCEKSRSITSFYQQVLNEPIKVGWVGSGCSLATEYTAELTPFYNLTQISCASALPDIEDQTLWRYYFQILPTTDILSHGYLNLILHFGWKKVSIITLNEPVFTMMMDHLKRDLEKHNVEYLEALFTDIEDIGETPYENGARIFIWATYPQQAQVLACEAHRRGLRYPKYQFQVFGWYPDGWWMDSPLFPSRLNCTEEQRARTLDYSFTVELLNFDYRSNETAVGGLTITDLLKLARTKYKSPINSHLGMSSTGYRSPELCYEATLSLAFALHHTLRDIETDETLNMEAGKEAGLSEGETFTLANFSYSNSVIVQRMFHHLSSTDFIGITGRSVNFNEDRRRVLKTLNIGQNRPNGASVTHIAIGTVRGASTENVTLDILDESKLWPNGTPTDGRPITNIVTLRYPHHICLTMLGIVGIIYSSGCMIFNFVHREKRVIRLSSPNLNYLIGIGAIIIYTGLITLSVRHNSEKSALVFYNLNICFANIGYSLSYGTISSKMVRVWYIFNNPNFKKKYTIRDRHLGGIVAVIVIIDIIIMVTYLIIEGATDNLKTSLFRSAAHPEKLIGPTAEVHHYFFYGTASTAQTAWYIILSVEKIILHSFALFLAIRTRKVKMKGLGDSKFIIAAAYATSIFTIPTQIGYFIFTQGYLDAGIGTYGVNSFLATTTLLSLAFVPKMVALYKDPTGENVGGSSIQARSIGTAIDMCNGGDKQREKEILMRKIEQLESRLEEHMGSGAGGPQRSVEEGRREPTSEVLLDDETEK